MKDAKKKLAALRALLEAVKAERPLEAALHEALKRASADARKAERAYASIERTWEEMDDRWREALQYYFEEEEVRDQFDEKNPPVNADKVWLKLVAPMKKAVFRLVDMVNAQRAAFKDANAALDALMAQGERVHKLALPLRAEDGSWSWDEDAWYESDAAPSPSDGVERPDWANDWPFEGGPSLKDFDVDTELATLWEASTSVPMPR